MTGLSSTLLVTARLTSTEVFPLKGFNGPDYDCALLFVLWTATETQMPFFRHCSHIGERAVDRQVLDTARAFMSLSVTVRDYSIY